MKKLLILFLSIMVLFAAMPTVSVSAAKVPTFVISTAKAETGDTVKITISTKKNSGIISMKLAVKYDNTALELTNYKKGKFENAVFGPKNNNPFIINWIDPLNPNNKKNGTVATLTFKVLDTAPEGKSEISLTYNPNDVFDSEFNNVTFNVEKGYVNIKKSDTVKQPSTSSQASAGNVSNNSNTAQTSSDTDGQTPNDTNSQVPDNTNSQILEQILNSNNQQNSDNNNNSSNTQTNDNVEIDDDTPQNNWVIWVVVIAAIVVLGGAFAVVIIKGKKD